MEFIDLTHCCCSEPAYYKTHIIKLLELYQYTTSIMTVEANPLFYGSECVPIKDNEMISFFLPNVSLKAGSQCLIEF